VPIADGAVKTACQQSCPTDAISFGNVRDKASAPAKRAEAGKNRAYNALQILNTRSAVTYLVSPARRELRESKKWHRLPPLRRRCDEPAGPSRDSQANIDIMAVTKGFHWPG